MAELHFNDDNSDSDEDDVLMVQLAEELLEGEFNIYEPARDREGPLSEAQRIVLEMVLNRRFPEGMEAGAADRLGAMFEAIWHREAPPQAGNQPRAAAAAAAAAAGDGRDGPVEPRWLFHYVTRRRMHNQHQRARLAELARCRRTLRQISQQREENKNLVEHSCHFCPTKYRKLQAAPSFKFHPTTLRQQILLQLGFKTYGKAAPQSADNLPLPDALIAEVKRVHEELKHWREDNKRFDETMRESTIYRCFLTDLHWLPGTTIVDHRATARMILQCDVGFYRPNEFLLAAVNCLEDEVARLWPLVDTRTRDRWAAAENPIALNPVLMYWISVCADQPTKRSWSLQKMTSFCINKGERGLDTLLYFWPLILESKGGLDSDEMKVHFDHSFHEAIECKNTKAAFFIWRQASVDNYRSMVSAAHCCGARNAYYAFEKAVESSLYEIVQFIWNRTDPEQHNGMLLAEHAKAFCTAAEHGYVEIAKLLWRDTTYNQRFVLLFEQSCAAFRRSCANGHVEIVRLLWQNASVEQRRQIMTMCQWNGISSACRNGHLNVVQYLWENMGEGLKSHFADTRVDHAMLSTCICEAVSRDVNDSTNKENTVDVSTILGYLFSIFPPKGFPTNPSPATSQLLNAFLLNGAAAMIALLDWAEKENKEEQIASLFAMFDPEERAQISSKVPRSEAYFFGLLPCVAKPEVMSTACIPKYSVGECSHM